MQHLYKKCCIAAVCCIVMETRRNQFTERSIIMSTTYPIKSEEKLKKFKEYYLFIKPVCRNYAMIILGLNTAFRIGDLLSLQWRDVFSEKKNCFKDHICIKEAAEYAGLEEHISCHSLRKTFGYHAWKQGVQPALLMELYNHSSYRVTKQYLCIEQDDKDRVYLTVQL